MVPFVRVEAGAFLFCRVLEKLTVDIKGDLRPCVRVNLYFHGKDRAPVVDDLIGMLTSVTPQEVLLPFNKAFQDAFTDDMDITGLLLTVRYEGQKEIGGGKRFNRWDIAEVVLTESERKALGEL